jgi:hypothetical protein
MANMQINYPNPVQNFAIGAQTGMALGSMWKKNNQDSGTVAIPDPGQRQQVDINQLTQQEQSDIAQYQDLEKKSKGLDPSAMYDVKRAAVDSSQSPIVKQAVLMGISPKELDMYMKDIQNKGISSPSAMALKGKMGGEDSAGWQAVQSKVAEIQNTQKKMDTEYANKVETTLTFIDKIHEDPKKFMSKTGQYDPSVPKVMSNTGNYINDLIGMGGQYKDYAMNWLELQKRRAQGGGNIKPAHFELVDDKGNLVTDKNGNAIQQSSTYIPITPSGYENSHWRILGQGLREQQANFQGQINESMQPKPVNTEPSTFDKGVTAIKNLVTPNSNKTSSTGKYTVGKIYIIDRQGTKAKYVGGTKEWEKVK